jgi:hypothetical protein
MTSVSGDAGDAWAVLQEAIRSIPNLDVDTDNRFLDMNAGVDRRAIKILCPQVRVVLLELLLSSC